MATFHSDGRKLDQRGWWKLRPTNPEIFYRLPTGDSLQTQKQEIYLRSQAIWEMTISQDLTEVLNVV